MCEIREIITMVKTCNDCLKHEISCVGSDEQQTECYYNNLLNELYELSLKEQDGDLLIQEFNRYIEIYDILTNAKIEIPFGIEI